MLHDLTGISELSFKKKRKEKKEQVLKASCTKKWFKLVFPVIVQVIILLNVHDRSLMANRKINNRSPGYARERNNLPCQQQLSKIMNYNTELYIRLVGKMNHQHSADTVV